MTTSSSSQKMDEDKEDAEEYPNWWGLRECAYCAPIQTRTLEESQKDKDEGYPWGRGRYANPVTCPYKYIEFGDTGAIYKREQFGVGCESKDPDFKNLVCNFCGISYGKIHHVGCPV
jgi:hypothetical protein